MASIINNIIQLKYMQVNDNNNDNRIYEWWEYQQTLPVYPFTQDNNPYYQRLPNIERSWLNEIGLSILFVKQGDIRQYSSYSLDNYIYKLDDEQTEVVTIDDILYFDQMKQLEIYNNKIKYIGKRAKGYVVGSGYKNPTIAIGIIEDIYKDDTNKIVVAKIRIENTNKEVIIYDFEIVNENNNDSNNSDNNSNSNNNNNHNTI